MPILCPQRNGHIESGRSHRPAPKAQKTGRVARDLRDAQQPGLIARLLPSGKIQFSVRYRFRGKQRRLNLGEYSDVVGIAEARKRARRAIGAVDDGKDPAGEQQAAKAVRTDTVATLADDYLKKHARKFKKSADQDQRILDVEVLPRWRDKSVRELTRRDVRQLVERVADRAPVMANRVLAIVRRMLNFAVDHDWIEANPAARVKKPAPETSRDRVLTDDELRRVWRVLSHFPTTEQKPAPGRQRATGSDDDPLCPVSPALAAYLKVRLLTAQRGGEVVQMRWADVDLDAGWWTIPGSHTKNGEPHRVPLVAEVVDLLAERLQQSQEDDEAVFTGRGGSSIVDRAKKAPAAIRDVLDIDFRGHDFRRTAATNMAAAGIPREHIAHVLNHVEGGPRATKVYDRYSRDKEKRIALETWARALDVIVSGKQSGATVTPITKGA